MPAAIAATRVSAQLKQDMTAAPARARAFAAAARPAHPAGCRCPAHGRRAVTVRGEHGCSLVQHPWGLVPCLLPSLGCQPQQRLSPRPASGSARASATTCGLYYCSAACAGCRFRMHSSTTPHRITPTHLPYGLAATCACTVGCIR